MAPDMRVCPMCNKEYCRSERKVTYIGITTEGGFETTHMVRTCSWACKAALEGRIREEFRESEKFKIEG